MRATTSSSRASGPTAGDPHGDPASGSLHRAEGSEALLGTTNYVSAPECGVHAPQLNEKSRYRWAGGGEQAIAGIKGSCERIQKAAGTILQSFEVGEQEGDQAA